MDKLRIKISLEKSIAAGALKIGEDGNAHMPVGVLWVRFIGLKTQEQQSALADLLKPYTAPFADSVIKGGESSDVVKDELSGPYWVGAHFGSLDKFTQAMMELPSLSFELEYGRPQRVILDEASRIVLKRGAVIS